MNQISNRPPAYIDHPASSAAGQGDRHMYLTALVFLMVLVGGTLLYPDTFSSLRLKAGPFTVSPTIILFAAALPPVALYMWRRRETLRWGVFDALLLSTMAYMAGRGLLGADTANEMGLVLGYCGYTLLVYYGAAVVAQKGGAAGRILSVLAALAVLISGYALIEYFLGENVVYSEIIAEKVPIKSAEFHRSGSTLAHPVVLGIFLVQVSPMLAYLFFTARRTSRRVPFMLTLVLAAAALFVTYTKGSWITLGVVLAGTIAFFALRRPQVSGVMKRYLVLLVATIVVLLVALAAFSYRNISFNVLSEERQSESFGLRYAMWSESLPVFAENPLFGVGMWQGSEVVFARVAADWEEQDEMVPIDDLYLTVLVEQGLVGFLLAASILALLCRQIIALIRRGGASSMLVMALAVSMTAVLINGVTADTLMLWPGMVLFWLAAGLVRSRLELAQSSPGGSGVAAGADD